jgi:maleylpyruvate isomerase
MATPTDSDVQARIEAIGDATARLQEAIDHARERSGATAFAAPSRLPDWTVGHVATHLARNADGLRRVLLAAQEGRQVTPYDSPDARVHDIDIGAARGTDAIAGDLLAAEERLADTLASLPEPVWSATVDLGRGGPTTADVILSARLAEVELHHHDLGFDDGLALLDDAQAHRLLLALLRTYVRTRDVRGMTLHPENADPIPIGDGGADIHGRAVDIVGWLAGRTDGSALTSDQPLPELPNW